MFQDILSVPEPGTAAVTRVDIQFNLHIIHACTFNYAYVCLGVNMQPFYFS